MILAVLKLNLPLLVKVEKFVVFELYFEDEIKKAERDILKHLTHLTPMTDEQKMEIITNTFNELYEQNHPEFSGQNLYFMDTIEEIRIIKGLDT